MLDSIWLLRSRADDVIGGYRAALALSTRAAQLIVGPPSLVSGWWSLLYAEILVTTSWTIVYENSASWVVWASDV